jgi:hypothetical protein
MLYKRKLMHFFLLCLIVTSCEDKRERIPGHGPIVELIRYKHWLYVYAGPNANRTDFVKMYKFGDLRPGVSPLKYVLSYTGPAEKIRMGDSPGEGVEYANRYGRIRITSEDGVYPLYFSPNDRRPNSLLTQHILKYINPNSKKEVVMLFECGFEQPYISVIIEGGLVQEVVWVDQGDLARRSDSSKCTD